MAQRFFLVPVQSSESAEAELNAFLSSHKVLTIDRRWVDLRACRGNCLRKVIARGIGYERFL